MSPQLSPVQRQVLGTISSGEATSYDELFGGHRFTSFAQHPQIRVPLPNGQYTTAAGRYQMTAPTWADEVHRLGLKDFSPVAQDQAALDLAQRTYSQRTGRDLISDTAQGLTDWSALSNQWTSLRGKTTAPSGATQLSSSLPLEVPSNQPALLKPAPALNPNPGSELDPTTALAALRAAAPGVSLSPIDHNPWSLTPSLIPVNHDPFQEAANSQ